MPPVREVEVIIRRWVYGRGEMMEGRGVEMVGGWEREREMLVGMGMEEIMTVVLWRGRRL